MGMTRTLLPFFLYHLGSYRVTCLFGSREDTTMYARTYGMYKL
jgi:hypothetical protein